MKPTPSLSFLALILCATFAGSVSANEIVDLGRMLAPAAQTGGNPHAQPVPQPQPRPQGLAVPAGQATATPQLQTPAPQRPIAPAPSATQVVTDAESVRIVQRGLNALGFNAGAADGVSGRRTSDAIRQFERTNGFQVTGQISPALVQLMRSVQPAPAAASPAQAMRQQENACTGSRCQAPAQTAPARNQRTPSHEATQPAKVEPVIEAVNRWFARSTGVMTENGLTRFPYGQMEPMVVCAPLRICAIELQPGEQVINVAIGDSARWELFPAATGTTTIVGVKSLISEFDPDVTTNALITTDRRVYTIILKTSKSDFVPRIGFYYPQDAVQSWARREDVSPAAVPGQGGTAGQGASRGQPSGEPDGLRVDLSRVNSNYSIEGSRNVSWRPTQAFDDGQRLYINLPANMSEMPAVFVDDRIVNSRVISGYMVIDKLGKTTTLLYGVGRNQQRVDIVKGRAASRSRDNDSTWLSN